MGALARSPLESVDPCEGPRTGGRRRTRRVSVGPPRSPGKKKECIKKKTPSWARKAFFQNWSRIKIHWHNSTFNIKHYLFNFLIVFWTKLGLCQWIKKPQESQKSAFLAQEAVFASPAKNWNSLTQLLPQYKTLSFRKFDSIFRTTEAVSVKQKRERDLEKRNFSWRSHFSRILLELRFTDTDLGVRKRLSFHFFW